MRNIHQPDKSVFPNMPITTGAGDHDLVQRFALRVVSELARTAGIQAAKADEEFLRLLVRAAQIGDPDLFTKLKTEMKRKRISSEQVIDIYFPSAIGIIGTAWHEAEIDVLSATLATSRLQNLLREMGQAWVSDRANGNGIGRILLALPVGEQHSLGAMVAANQLRRLGVSVKVGLLSGGHSIEELMEGRNYHGVFVSVSNDSSVDSCAALIKSIRHITAHSVPIVVGGGLVCRAANDNKAQRIAGITGADLASSDVNQALHICGLQRATVAAE